MGAFNCCVKCLNIIYQDKIFKKFITESSAQKNMVKCGLYINFITLNILNLENFS
jgi:hypothetical protein